MEETCDFFLFYSFFFGFICQKNTLISAIKFGIQRIKFKKYTDFSCKLGKLAIQIKDDFYINWKNVQIGECLIISPKI